LASLTPKAPKVGLSCSDHSDDLDVLTLGRLEYTGRENDESQLYHYRRRYYSALLHRFISEDPSRFNKGINFYRYVDNDPINQRDPLGLGKITIVSRIFKKHRPDSPGDWSKFKDKDAMPDQIEKTVQEGTVVEDLPGRKTYEKKFDEVDGTRGEHYAQATQNTKTGEVFSARPRKRSRIPGSDVGEKIGGFVGVPGLSDVIDFFNPLNDLQEIIDIYDETFGPKK
jgi:RHS repeat-associated protein